MDVGSIDYRRLFLSFDGRINRLPFWIGAIILAVVSGVANYLVAMLLAPLGYWLLVIGLLAVLAVFAYPSLALIVKRLHDRDMPEVWAALFYGVPAAGSVLAILVPSLAMVFSLASAAAGLWALWELGIQPGMPGDNDYGPDPLAAKLV